MLKHTLLQTLAICTAASLAITQPVYAQISEFELTASDGAVGDAFGISVSISGDYAVVGAFTDDDNGDSSGSAYVFKRTGTSWTQEAKLLPFDGAAGDLFGASISISGDYVIVGARADDDNGDSSGSAYMFKRSGTSWTQEAKLLPSVGAVGDAFGASVSIFGDYAVIGAHLDDDNGDSSGSAYVFKRTGTSWTQEAKLLPFDGAAGDLFGASISISGDYVIVGARADDDNGDSSGSAYIFKRSGTSWTQEAKLLPSVGAEGDAFGISVSISGDYAVIGAHLDDDNGTDAGSAYVFKRTGTSWTQEAKLLPSDVVEFDFFGISVSISGDYALMGAIGSVQEDDNGTNSGSAYVFKRTGTSWALEAKLLPSDGAAEDWFGYSVSIAAGYAVVGAWKLDVASSAYVYNGFIPSSNFTFDLDGSTLLFSPNAVSGYDVNTIPFSFDAVLGSDVFAGDDTNHEFNITSGFSFPFFGTNWTNIWVRSNGNITFGGIGNADFFDLGDFRLKLPMIAAFFGDLDPSAGGAVFYKDEATKFTVTWSNIPEFGVSNSNTIQLVLFSDGSFQITYNGVDIVSPSEDSLLVGFNSGRVNPLIQSVDFTNVPINGGSNDVLFEFFGPQVPTIALSPDPLNFGDVQVGSSGQIVLSISNTGNAPLDITNITITNSDFSVASPTSFQVAAGASINKTVTFTPSSEGLKSGTLTIASSASNLPSSRVDLSGTGIESGDLQNPTVQINSGTSTSVPLGGTATVSVTATDNVGVSIAELKWRRGGDEAYTVTTMSSLGNNVYESSITNITAKGVQWFVDATDASENFGTTGEQNISAELSTTNFSSSTISGSAYPSGFPSGVWRLISVPADLTNSSISNVLSELGTSGPTTWRLFRWVNGAFSEFTGSFDAGNAFWLQQRVQGNLTIKPGSGTTTANTDFTKSLSPGWNLIGNPFAYPVKWTNANTNIGGPITYTDASGYLPAESYLQPWTGYWVRNNSSTNQTLTIEPILHTGTVRNLGKSVQIDPLENLETTRIVENGGWFVNISLNSAVYGDQFNYIGAVENAKDGYDKYDSRELPRMGDYVNLYFPHEDWGQYSANYTSDMRSAQQQGYTWDFEVKTNLSKEEMKIDIQNIEMTPAGMEVVLIDLDFRIAQDIRKSSIYHYFSGTSDDPKRFKLLIGESGYIGKNNDGISIIPNTYSISQNFPNPFNPTTTFTYSLPEAVHVNIQIYNILGERMATLVNEQMNAGSHMIRWNAGNIATGVYFYRIRAGNYHAVKKMVFIK